MMAVRIEVADELLRVRSPAVGIWRSSVREGALVNQLSSIGTLTVLGQTHELFFDSAIAGAVSSEGGRDRDRVVSWDDVLFEIDPSASAGRSADVVEDDSSGDGEAGLSFRSPTSGRFYSRPEPEKPPFVAVGQILRGGDPVCMLEVMKTYSRVRYDGEPAKVVSVRPIDQDDLQEGDVILELELVA